jgi:hypothetical protein
MTRRQPSHTLLTSLLATALLAGCGSNNEPAVSIDAPGVEVEVGGSSGVSVATPGASVEIGGDQGVQIKTESDPAEAQP